MKYPARRYSHNKSVHDVLAADTYTITVQAAIHAEYAGYAANVGDARAADHYGKTAALRREEIARRAMEGARR